MTARTPEAIVERRTKLLKMEGTGFDRIDIVKTLSQDFQCTERTVYRDFQTRSKWQPQLTGHSDRQQAYQSILNRFEQIYKKASFTYINSKNESVIIAALRVMLDALSRIKELTGVANETGDGGKQRMVIMWKPDKSLEDSMKASTAFAEWTQENINAAEQETLRQARRIFVRYELETKIKEETEIE